MAAYGNRCKKILSKESPEKNRVPQLCDEAMKGIGYGRNVLIVAGDRDPWIDVENLRTLSNGKSNIEVWTVPNAGHYPHVSKPANVAQAIEMFKRAELPQVAVSV